MGALEFVFAGGGTGGHLYPGLAVADAVRVLRPDARITFFTTTRPLDRQLLESTPYGQVPQPVQPFTKHPLRLPGFLWAWQRSVAAATDYLRRNAVKAVLGLGGYAAGPAVIAARRLRIWVTILNPDAVPGRANRYLARRSDLVVLQWDVTRRYFSPRTYCQTLGCPIRAGFATADGAAGRRHFGLSVDQPALVVTGASQGARTVNQVLMRVWPAFWKRHPEWQLLHLTGAADEAEVRAAYERAEVPAHVVPFTHEMPLALAAADLVISRAGASTLAELTALGRPSILLPYPYHRDRHQHANAAVLVDHGAAVVLEDRIDPEQNEAPLRSALEDLNAAAARQRMAKAARELGRPRAAEDVAAWLLS